MTWPEQREIRRRMDSDEIRLMRKGEISMSTQENVQIVKNFFAALGPPR